MKLGQQNRSVFSKSFTMMVTLLILVASACGDDSGAVDATIIDAPPSGGTFSLAWNIQDGAEKLECQEVGGLSVAVRLVVEGGSTGVTEAFSCRSGQAKSRTIPVGSYDMTIDLRTSGSRSLLANPIRLEGIVISQNQDTTLDSPLAFAVARQGFLRFKVDGKSMAGNCESNANNGSGLIGLAFTLKDKQGNCIPATFRAEAGTQSAATYVRDCVSEPAPMPCIGRDQQVEVQTNSGGYKLLITGQKTGPVNCYTRESNFDVPGANLSTELGALDLSLEYSAQCDLNYIPPDAGSTPDAGVDGGN